MKYEQQEDRTFDEAVEEYLKNGMKGLADGTKQTYRSHIRSFRNWVQGCDCGWINQGRNDWSSIEDCTCDTTVDTDLYSGEVMFKHVEVGDVEDWIEELADSDASDQTVQKSYYAVMGMLESEHPDGINKDDHGFNLVKQRYISGWDSTRQSQEEREEIQYLTKDQVKQLWEHVPEPKIRNELIVRLMWHTGMRQSDLVEVKLDDVIVDNNEIKMWDVKNQKPRSVYFGDSIKPLVRSWIDRHRAALSPSLAERSEYLIYGDKSPQMDSKKINDEIIRPAAESAGIQSVSYTDSGGKTRSKVTGHILRHSFARKFVIDGGDIRRLQDLLGHSDISQTEKYLRFREKEKKEARESYGPQ